MSVILSSITGRLQDATVTIGNTEVKFRYRPYAITLGMSMSLAAGEEDMLDVLDEVIESWDVVEKEGEPFPPNAENLAKVPTELATLIAQEVISGSSNEVGEAGGN